MRFTSGAVGGVSILKIRLLILLLVGAVLPGCGQKKASDERLTTAPYREYLSLAPIVEIHGETADSTQLGDDRYLEDNLDYLLAKHEWVLVNFSAYWCKDCRKFDPDYQAVAGLPKYKGIFFTKAEIDGTKGNENFRTRFALPGIPVTILFHNGQIVEEGGQKAILFGQRGDKTKADLTALLDHFYQPAAKGPA